MFKTIRLILLVSALLFVGLSAYQLKTAQADWSSRKWVTIYPINADDSQASQAYIDALDDESFRSISEFMGREFKRYGGGQHEPVIVRLGPQVRELPPPLDSPPSLMTTLWWNVKLRLWAARVRQHYDGPPADIDMFVQYHDPATHGALQHSVGIAKMSLGIVNAFATRRMTESNNVVIAHEMLHVVGASDKYDLRTNQPIYPEGYVEPNAEPLYPQKKAEIMAGRIPVSRSQARTPKSLKSVVVGEQTAREINWRVR
ncbi:MAG TPA: hypothetical protein ENK35_06150 [Candidatus Tenderia sp.]|nr:hypothetical protein [Candidatus Tenderia sp.]